jgi:hypothetical protein
VNNPQESSLGFAVLVIPMPAHQGMIFAIHSLSKFAARLRQPATQWDDHIFGSIGEVVAKQNPTTVKLPSITFSRQNGGNLFWVGQAQCMAAMFGANPNLQLLKEFTNFDTGTKLVQSQNLVPIPHRYMTHPSSSLGDFVGIKIITTTTNLHVNCSSTFSFLPA